MARFEKGTQVGALSRFVPGKSGNPRGRPKIKPIRVALRELLNSRLGDDERTVAECLAAEAIERSLSRDRDSLKWMKFVRGTVEGHLDHVTEDDDHESFGGESRSRRP